MDTPIKDASDEEASIEDDTSLEQSEERIAEEDSEEIEEDSEDNDTSKDESQEDAAILRKRLSDKDKHIVKLEKDLKEKAKAEKPDTRSDEVKDLEFKLTNKDRIALVQEEYDRILEEGYEGEEITSKKIALELAEKIAKIDDSSVRQSRQNDMTTTSTTARNDEEPIQLTEFDKRFGLTAKKKRELERKHPHLAEPL